ncbi:hypothetical protein Mmc1_3323 [Magnetococcus marinus MC-1]|uniref:Uncharacterized protein n=1 Tax=Magnetococcus marinus (strain ATCC BAA-1437 / JCM 17883 / MC-1) TaxID=156889 RepID=A0LCW7_MAGMM|nr:hypothetical protein [Magnetococcus marinus]ABK45810.1 hypothetical protein Mmc1_3323 [Magnetococcus marinus MC-1]
MPNLSNQLIVKLIVPSVILGNVISVTAIYYISQEQDLGGLKFIALAGCFLSAIAALFLKEARKSAEYHKIQLEIINNQEKLAAIKEKESYLKEAVDDLQKKESAIRDKLVLLQQFKEFNDADKFLQEEIHQQSEQDKEVSKFIDEKIHEIFDRIKTDYYTKDGQFQWGRMEYELVSIAQQIAKIYHPDAKSPILETNIEKTVRAFNRLSLQLLVMLDQLPFNMKETSLSDFYAYIKKGVAFYKVYKKAEPILSKAKYVTPLLRISAGSHPLTAVASTVAAEAGKEFIKHKKEAMGLATLSDLVNMVGDQVAYLYGPSVRFRGIEWLFSLELTEISKVFHPLPHNVLSQSLQTVSGISFKSEYDRIYVYRHLAAGKSLVYSVDGAYQLNQSDRSVLVEKLESFINESGLLAGEEIYNSKKTFEWRKQLFDRCGSKLSFKADFQSDSDLKQVLHTDSPVEAVDRNLASFILNLVHILPDFIYDHVSLPDNAICDYKKFWMVGAKGRLELVAQHGSDALHHIWQFQVDDDEIALNRVKHTVSDDCHILGGRWLIDMPTSTLIMIEGKIGYVYGNHFKALIKWKSDIDSLRGFQPEVEESE